MGARVGEVEVLTLAIGEEVLVDELGAIVAVETLQRKRQASPQLFHRPPTRSCPLPHAATHSHQPLTISTPTRVVR
jgi:hypothetical protein